MQNRLFLGVRGELAAGVIRLLDHRTHAAEELPRRSTERRELLDVGNRIRDHRRSTQALGDAAIEGVAPVVQDVRLRG